MTCRLYATRHDWPLARVVVEIGHTGKTASDRDLFVRKIGFEGALSSDQRARLLEIAERCPVHKTLGLGADVVTQPLPNDLPDDGAPDSPEDHARKMEETCSQVEGSAVAGA